jgi:alpha-galactosidase/6-phospho-beta-glucosidase family protein
VRADIHAQVFATLPVPHTTDELNPEQISQLVDALIEAHGGWLPAFVRRAEGARI